TGRRSGELADLFRQTLVFDWPDPEALSDFLEGGLMGATDCAQQGEWTPAVEQAWLRTIESLITHWPFDKLGSEDRQQFPLHGLWSVIDTDCRVMPRTSPRGTRGAGTTSNMWR